MWPGIIYGIAIALAVFSIFAPHVRRRSRRNVPVPGPATVSWVPIIAAAIVLVLGAGLAVRFGIFYQVHWTGPNPGSIRYGAEDKLFGYHFLLSLLCLAVAAHLIWMMCKKRVSGLCGLAGIGVAVAAAKAFLLTVPRGGDEGVIVWVFLGTFLLVSVVVLFICSIIIVMRSCQLLLSRPKERD